MATVLSQGDAPVSLSAAQTDNGDSTNIAFRGLRDRGAALVIASVIGATPTVTVNIQGSVDGVTFANIPYLAAGTWTGTAVVTAIVITTAVTNFYVLSKEVPWRFLKLVLSANTNVTLTADAYL